MLSLSLSRYFIKNFEGNRRKGAERRNVSGLLRTCLVQQFLTTLTYYSLRETPKYGMVATEEVGHAERESPYQISLSESELRELSMRAAKYTLPYFMVIRAKMILLAAEGLSNDEIATRLHTRREVVSSVAKRFFQQRIEGLEERPRPGRPRSFPRPGRSDQGAGV